MYSVKFYKHDDTLAYTVPSENIISVNFTENSVAVEEDFARTPQRCTLELVKSQWLEDNILNLHKATFVYGALLSHKVVVAYDNNIVVHMIILADAVFDAVESGVCSVICYDYTKLLHIFEDIKFTPSGAKSGYTLQDITNEFADKINQRLGSDLSFNISQRTAGLGVVNSETFARFNVTELQNVEGDQLSLSLITAKEPQYNSFSLFGRRTNLGFSYEKDSPFPRLYFVNLEIYEAYNSEASYNVVTGSWDIRPKYLARLVIDYIEFYNITGYKTTRVYNNTADWAFISPQHVSAQRPSFNYAFVNCKWGLDDTGEQNRAWEDLVLAYNGAVYDMVRVGDVGNSLYFNPAAGAAATRYNLPAPNSGSYNIAGVQPHQELTVEELKNIRINRTGQVVPYSFNFDVNGCSYLDALRTILYSRLLTMFPSVTDGVKIRIEPIQFISGQTPGVKATFQPSSVEYFSEYLRGVFPQPPRRLVGLYQNDSLDFLVNHVLTLYKNYQYRRELEINVITGEELEPFDFISYKGLLCFVKSIKKDYRTNLTNILLGIVDQASLRVDVKDAVSGAGLKGAVVKIGVQAGNYYSQETSSRGQAVFYSMPVLNGVTIEVSRNGYITASTTINITSETLFTKTVQLQPQSINSPEVTPTRLVTEQVLVSINAEGSKSVFYSINGGGDTEYALPFVLSENAYLEAYATGEDDGMSEITEEEIVASINIPKPRVISVYNDSLKRKLVQVVSDTPGSIVRYTVDGSEPDEDSPVYSQEVAIDKSIDLSMLRVKSFIGEYGSDTETVYNLSDRLELTDEFDSSMVLSQVFPPGVHCLDITILTTCNHRQEVSGVDVNTVMGTVQRAEVKAFVTDKGQAWYSVVKSLDDTILGKSIRYEDGVLAVEFDEEYPTGARILVWDVDTSTTGSELRISFNVSVTPEWLRATAGLTAYTGLTDVMFNYRIIIEPKSSIL